MSELGIQNFIVLLANEVDKLTSHFVFDGYRALADLLKAPLASMLVLYIVLTGYAMVRGVIQRPQQTLMTFCIKAGLIYLGAMNWGWFASHVRDLFLIGSESIATTLMQAVHKKTVGHSINQGLQTVLNDILTLGSSLFEIGSLRNLTPYFAGMMVFLSGSITVGFALIEIIIAKLMIGVTLCTAPLFILFTLFDQTKSFFERWLGVLSGFAFVLIFVSSVVGLCIHLLHWVTTALTSNAEQFTAVIWVPIFIVAGLCIMGIKEAVSIGKSIGGSLCTSHGASMVGGFIGGSLGAWGYSKTLMQKPMGASRQGLARASSVLEKSQRLRSSVQQWHKNLRGTS